MKADERRNSIVELLHGEKGAIKGTILAEKFNVTRQIIVKDIAILRAKGNNIIATPDGYMINEEKEKLNRIKKSKKKLLDLVKLIDNKINELQDNVCTDLKNIPGAKVEYKKLLKKDIEWDKAEPDISSKESLEFITTVLAKIKVLIENQNNYRHCYIFFFVDHPE